MEERRLEKDVATNLSDCVPQGRNGPCARSVRIIFTADSQENDMDVTKKLVMRFTRAPGLGHRNRRPRSFNHMIPEKKPNHFFRGYRAIGL